jgi:hypothetical protein
MSPRRSVVLVVRPPGMIARWVYRRRGRAVPLAATRPTPTEVVGAAIPRRWRRWHHWLAVSRGYFWLPCPTCGREFGGHESGDSLTPPDASGISRVSCTDCTRRMRAA